ncbi:hypothetical protein ACQEK6_001064 [Escherichia coli]|nr:hypothetical protein [Escherichia coli]
MSMVARTNPGPAEDDITDTDDGDKRAIELLEQRRLQRLNNEDNNHAEN